MRLKKNIKWMILVVAVVVVGVLFFANREWIGDWWRGIIYRPSDEMVAIREKLDLTERGEFLFNASQPELSGSDEFNENCRTELDMETAVLGCYIEGNIYVYDITAKELDGIRELTAAHELLHAVWARMSEAEQRGLTRTLTQTFEKNQSLLEDEIDSYDASQRQEELYVRVGTEVKNLPTELEEHYAEVFTDQDLIVEYYEGYIGVFNRMKAEMEGLMAEMEEIQAQIDTLSADYESRLTRLNAQVTNFNSCAERAGCFGSESEFYAQRNSLISEQNALEGVYNEINRLVDEYNARVEKYNEDVAYSRKLNNIVNSKAKPEAVE